ncbi:MAG: ABC transporter ATP-binding protein [Lachnospiraceae bacterium]|nr:ABC transporter ATP-binding protein [Lachnospiraceae bacterium]
MSSLLKVNSLTKKYGNITALNNLSFELESGHITGLLGPNGSGKTTLIKIICGLLVPTAGEVTVKGNPIGVESKKVISYLPDTTYLGKSASVEGTINYFKDFYEDFDTSRAYDMLGKLGIDPRAKLRTLSKGTKEKVQLILVMSRRADLYILDEPIAGVDPAARDYILDTIITNYDENASILISTHLISDIENILDEVIFLKQGNLVRQSSVDEIRSSEGKSVDGLFMEVFKC